MVGRRGYLFPRERQWQEDAVKTCNAFNVFSGLPCNWAHYPSKCGCCFLLSPRAPWLTVHLVFWLTCSHCLWPCVKQTADSPSALSSASEGEMLKSGSLSTTAKRPWENSPTSRPEVTACCRVTLRRGTLNDALGLFSVVLLLPTRNWRVIVILSPTVTENLFIYCVMYCGLLSLF